MEQDIFDFIVVGAGAAGCALASRLTENNKFSVLLLEAGGTDHRLWVRVPLGVGKLLGDPSIFWSPQTSPEPGLLGRRITWLSGRLLGGSSSINGMLVVRGNPAKYDEWAASHAPGWAYRDVLKYFKRLEQCELGDAAYRGRHGPISVEEISPHVLGQAFIEACGMAGYGRVEDYNSVVTEGAAPWQINIRRGLRCSASTAYLRPALRRPNLALRCSATAQRVLFQGKQAIGVQYHDGQETHTVRARREVILCGGAVRSPQLLELSGIGHEEILHRFQIPVIRHIPGVGANLQDHLMVRVCFESKHALTIYGLLNSRLAMLREITRYATRRQGLFATTSFPALAFIRTDSMVGYPDARIQIGLAVDRLSSNHTSGLDRHPGFHLGGYPIYPRSRGHTHIKSRDARDAPVIHANYLMEQEDCAATVRILRILRTIASQPPLSNHIVREVRPGEDLITEESLLEYGRRNGDTCWHPTGTCQMGEGPNAVVDSELRVHGITGLRIADASVFTSMIASNTHFPTIMVAERAADMVLAAAGIRKEQFPESETPLRYA
jgi:choline dehydrogenase